MLHLEDFLILSGLLTAGILWLTVKARPPESEGEEADDKPEAESRWRRFRLDVDALRSGAPGAPLLREEPEGLTWVTVDGALDDLPLTFGPDEDTPSARIDRKALAIEPVFRLRLHGRPWIAMRPRRGRNFPEFTRVKGPTPAGVPPLADISLQGSLPKREYEMRCRGRLTVSVTREVRPDEGAEESAYWIEVLKGVDAAPYLALTLALEVAVSFRGVPIERSGR